MMAKHVSHFLLVLEVWDQLLQEENPILLMLRRCQAVSQPHSSGPETRLNIWVYAQHSCSPQGSRRQGQRDTLEIGFREADVPFRVMSPVTCIQQILLPQTHLLVQLGSVGQSDAVPCDSHFSLAPQAEEQASNVHAFGRDPSYPCPDTLSLDFHFPCSFN